MNDLNDKYIKLCDKPFEEMALLELYAEYSVHKWLRTQMNYHIKRLKKRVWWLEQNKPILSKEEIRQQYEDGKITKAQFNTAYATRQHNINYRMRVDDYMEFADKIVFHEEAVVQYIEELVAKKQASQPMTSKKNTRGYDPRKRESVNNQRKWNTRELNKQMPKLKAQRKRWRAYKEKDQSAVYGTKLFPIVTEWEAERLKHLARDRGYFTDAALVAAVGEALDISMLATSRLLNSGKFSWGQCVAIAGFFEMTPKEFCDIFLHGVFKETGDGVYKAQIGDVRAFLKQEAEEKKVTEEVEADGEDQRRR